MMSNLYPFLMGGAALKHEKIDKFPDVPEPENHLLMVHCGFFGVVPRPFCSHGRCGPRCSPSWTTTRTPWMRACRTGP